MLAKLELFNRLPLSLGTKLAGAVLGLLVLVTIVVYWQASRHEQQGLIRAKEAAATAVVRLFADSCEAPVVFDDAAAISDALDTLGHDQEIQYAAVWRAQQGQLTTVAGELARGPSEPPPALTDHVAPLAFDTLEKAARGEDIPSWVVVEDVLHDASNTTDDAIARAF